MYKENLNKPEIIKIKEKEELISVEEIKTAITHSFFLGVILVTICFFSILTYLKFSVFNLLVILVTIVSIFYLFYEIKKFKKKLL